MQIFKAELLERKERFAMGFLAEKKKKRKVILAF